MSTCIICLKIDYDYKIKCTRCINCICNKCCDYELFSHWCDVISNKQNDRRVDYKLYDIIFFRIPCSYKCGIDTYIHENEYYLGAYSYDNISKIQKEIVDKYRNNIIMPMLNFHLIKDLSKIIIEYE